MNFSLYIDNKQEFYRYLFSFLGRITNNNNRFQWNHQTDSMKKNYVDWKLTRLNLAKSTSRERECQVKLL